MKLSRMFFLSAMLVCGLLFAKPAPAQENKQQAEPFVVISIASIETLRDDLGYFLELADQKQLLHMADFLVESAGLDTTKPIVATVSAGGALPSAVVYVPTANLKKLLASLKPIFQEQKRIGSDTYELSGMKTVFARWTEGYTVFALERSDVEGKLRIPNNASRQAKKYDVSATVKFQNIPPAYRQIVLSSLRNSGQLSQAPFAGSSDARIDSAINDGFKRLFNEADAFTCGIRISPKKRHLIYDTQLTALPNTELASLLNSFKSNSNLNKLINKQAPLNIALKARLPRMLSDVFVREFEKEIAAELRNDAGDNSVEEQIKRRIIESLSHVVKTNARDGRVQLNISMSGSAPGPFTIYGATRIADAESLQDTIDEIVRDFGSNIVPPGMNLDIAKHNGLRIHEIDVPIADPQGRRFFGDRAKLHFSVSHDTVFFAFGGASERELKRVIDLTADRQESPAEAPPVYLQIRAGAWIRSLSMDNQGDPMADFARTVLSSKDRLTFAISPIGNGVRARLEFEEDYLKLLAKAFSLGYSQQQNPQPKFESVRDAIN